MDKDPIAPLTKRLKLLARDSQNVAMNVLAIFAGTKQVARSRDDFATELHKLVEQTANTARAWDKLQDILLYLESKTGELDEMALVKVVEGIADSAMISQNAGEVWRLAQTDCALRMLKLEPDLIPYALKELKSHSPEQYEVWLKAFNDD